MYLISHFEVRILMCFSSHQNGWNVTEASRNLGGIWTSFFFFFFLIPWNCKHKQKTYNMNVDKPKTARILNVRRRAEKVGHTHLLNSTSRELNCHRALTLCWVMNLIKINKCPMQICCLFDAVSNSIAVTLNWCTHLLHTHTIVQNYTTYRHNVIYSNFLRFVLINSLLTNMNKPSQELKMNSLMCVVGHSALINYYGEIRDFFTSHHKWTCLQSGKLFTGDLLA